MHVGYHCFNNVKTDQKEFQENKRVKHEVHVRLASSYCAFSRFPSIRHEMFSLVLTLLDTSSILSSAVSCSNGVGVTMLLVTFKMKQNQNYGSE
jgi:hypothetical protein